VIGSPGGRLHIVVTCTERKTAQAPAHLRLRDIPAGGTTTRAQAWVNRLKEQATGGIQALELYAGEHWKIAVGLPKLTPDADTDLWVCSAGYGFIPATAAILPYAATVSPGHPDSVTGGLDGAMAWWRHLSSWDGPEPGQPRSIRALAQSDPEASYVLVLSAAYLQACRADIEAAAELVKDPQRFMIVSAGTRTAPGLAELLLPTDARLAEHLGGTRQVLNMRIAADLLASQHLDRTSATKYLLAILAGLPPLKQYDRKKLTDDEVLHWIRQNRESIPSPSASRLLRVLRDTGYACEQHRFGELYKSFLEGTG
jgi:hypothetical protein